MQYGARQLGCTKVQVHSYPDEPSHGARCSSAPVVTRVRGCKGMPRAHLELRETITNGALSGRERSRLRRACSGEQGEARRRGAPLAGTANSSPVETPSGWPSA